MTRLGPDRATLYLCEVGGAVAFRWACEDSGTWQAILTSLKTSLPHWTGRRYSPESRLWYVPGHARRALLHWADCWFTPSAQCWIDDEASETHGTRSGRPQRHSGALTEAYTALHLLPTAPSAVVTAAHRAMARLSHPDMGGTHEQAVAVNAAIALIRERRQRVS